MSDFITSLKLWDIWEFLKSGSPSFLTQLLVFNGTMLVVMIFSKPSKPQEGRGWRSTILRQFTIFGCLVILTEPQWLGSTDDARRILDRALHPILRTY